MNLIREFEIQRMKDSETDKKYSNKLLSIVNKIRILGNKLPDNIVVEKIIVTLAKKFDHTIVFLENTKYMSKIFDSALQAQKQ